MDVSTSGWLFVAFSIFAINNNATKDSVVIVIFHFESFDTISIYILKVNLLH
ncbi:hypothetical protein PULV_a2875 [Pseudoalteromonas ulvae UL12]|nr:hypothetical protein [Pseudoalteromonas ulvae UL12]